MSFSLPLAQGQPQPRALHVQHQSRPQPRTLPDLITPDEVAAWLRTTVGAIYAKAERGTLPGATRVGRRLYFLRSELLGLVEQGRVPHLRGPGGGT
ncbi:MAG: helix-turn-helix domain-containing protein [Polyangiaceae bacterium]